MNYPALCRNSIMRRAMSSAVRVRKATLFSSLVNGKIKIVKGVSDTEEQVLAVRGPGTFFGEMALVDNKPRSASVIAQVNTKLLTLSKESFIGLIESRPSFSLSVIRILSERLRDTDEIMVESLKWKNIELEEAYERLSELNKTLEQRVKDRTNELEHKNLELEKTIDIVQKMQVQLVQSEKIASLGKMVAGIAHELNNPLGVISGNLDFIDDYLEQINTLIAGDDSRQNESVSEEYQKIYQELKDILTSCKRSSERTKNIVSDLRTFSRFGMSSR